MIHPEKDLDLVWCAGCKTWQHDRTGKCPKCGRFTSKEMREKHEYEMQWKQALEDHKTKKNEDWSEECLEEAKRTLAGFGEKEAARRKRISESKKSAEEAAERSKALAMLCISKYKQDDELPPASVMSRILFLETGLVIHKTVLVRYLRQFGYTRFQKGWRKIDA